MQRVPAQPRPALPPASLGLAGLWALLETQATALREGRADDLPALTAQMQSALVHAQRFSMTAPPEQLQALRQLAAANLALAQRRLGDVEAAQEALLPAIPAMQEAQRRSTYAPAGRLGVPRISGRSLGRA
ncbi:hypothetical protein ACT80S_17740 [Ramlibacter sp. MAHUQ-53]|uniref:hypothetical protein n=1 Tax=unclassified Ramlibacter TaxID=2617605 RepID=UPI003642A241